ncbi:MAG TPA: carboxyl transferase domain-containing protein, partial [Longimicrobiales bacterium]|nr:carboxyl transferase domain-containing protein [Longimicrobiales bacterium]
MAHGREANPTPTRSRRLARELKELETRLRAGGGPERAQRQHEQGKLTARERIERLLDPGSAFLEVGLLIAWDQYDGAAPAAGVVTGLGAVAGRPIVVVANDATVKAGSWWPETVRKILRAQEIAMRCRLPIVYLVDSAGVNLPYQDGVFPGQYGASRIFYYNSIMRRRRRIPQIAAVMGPCIAGGAYLPALSDVIYMVDGTSFMGLGGPNLVKGATGQSVGAEELGGARTHTRTSGVAHYLVPDDDACLAAIREHIANVPYSPPAALTQPEPADPPARDPGEIHELLPDDHRQPYDMRAVLSCILDGGRLHEFQPEHASELICANARLGGVPVGVIANARGMFPDPGGGPAKFGGIIYTESAEKAAYFIDAQDRAGVPLLF